MIRITVFALVLVALMLTCESVEARECSPQDRQMYQDRIHSLERNLAHFHEQIAWAERELGSGKLTTASADHKRNVIKNSEKEIHRIDKEIDEARKHCKGL